MPIPASLIAEAVSVLSLLRDRIEARRARRERLRVLVDKGVRTLGLLLDRIESKMSPPHIAGHPDDERDPHEDNAYDLPDGKPVREELQRRFADQLKATLGPLPAIGSPLPVAIRGPHDEHEMAETITPILSAYWDDGGKTTRARIGLDPADWRVTDPHVRDVIRETTFGFCKKTNETTRLKLDEAHAKLREELTTGVVDHGEAIPSLRKRIQSIFTEASDSRADMIARTETSRAIHAASLMSAKESGVVRGKKWLLSANACEECHALAAQVPEGGMPLDAEFAVIGSNPSYANIKFPPAHPHCRCSETYVIVDDYIDEIEVSEPSNGTFMPGPLGPDPKPKRPYRGRLSRLARAVPIGGAGETSIRRIRSILAEYWPELLGPETREVSPEAPVAPAKPLPPIAELLKNYKAGDEIVKRLAGLDQTYREARKRIEVAHEAAVEAILKAQRGRSDDDPAIRDANARLDDVAERTRKYRDFQSAMIDLVIGAVKNPNATAAPIKSKFRPNHPAAAAIVAGEGFLAETLVADSLHPKGLKVEYARARGKNARAHYVEARQQVWVADTDESTIVGHELGHAIEHQWEEVGEAARQFLKYRVGREHSKNLAKIFPDSHFDAWETGRKDKFDRAFDLRAAYYCGKDYRSRAGATVYSTEILSMGLEKLMTDPVGFATNDPEYCKFVVGVLRGEIRAAKEEKPKPKKGLSYVEAKSVDEEPALVVGSIAFQWQGQPVAATLGDDLRWTIKGGPDYLRKYLGTLYGPPIEPSPSQGWPGMIQLRAAATDLGADLRIDPVPSGPADRIY